jgi:hypothetical protein
MTNSTTNSPEVDNINANSTEQTPWYILKNRSGHCEVSQIELAEGSAPGEEEEDKAPIEQWGPFKDQNEAAAHRVGLIRSGKCLPE